ncbi:MAG: hypothetical protein CO103_05030 [Chloroflexi bacterium CG_4_9_14_3_um_filter_45_9]|nr:MAG: hypothetical protein CO103_05030 [Chloroflexi bacterium CG_4_9_14_3_um_filter_45_9]
MKKVIKLYKQPEVKTCFMLASWPGIGNVSLIATRYLIEKLNALEIGEIDAPAFFEPLSVAVRDNIVEVPRFPESKFYYWQDAQGEKGLVLFIAEEQPVSKGHELVSCVLDAARELHVARIYSCAAAVTHIHHSEEPKVWGAATKKKLLGELKEYGVILRGNLRIAGLNGLILGMARERDLEGICLLGEVPSYAIQVANPSASVAVLKVLTNMLDIPVDLAELIQLAKKSSEEMDKLAKQATAEFIDQFTEPIWERDEGEE